MTPGEPTRLELVSHEGQAGADVHEFALHVPPSLRWFRGHFDGNPVLPAVVQVREALFLAAIGWPELAGLRRCTRLKFRRPIRPGDAIQVRLSRVSGRDKIAFEFERRGQSCSSGTLEFGAANSPGAGASP